MFPDNWTEDDVKNSIAEAYSQKKNMKNKKTGNIEEVGLDGNGNKIVFYHDENGNILTSFPSFEDFDEIINYDVNYMKIQHIGIPTVKISKHKSPWSYIYRGVNYSVNFPLIQKGRFFPAILPSSEVSQHKILKGIKSVTVNWEAFNERDKKEKEDGLVPLPLGSSTETIEEFYRVGKFPLSHLISVFDVEDDETPKEYRKWLPYYWGNVVYDAIFWKDITEISDGEGNKEYYYTSEIIEALEKWEVLSKKWDDPEERAKMIEEYEKNNS